MKYGQVVLISSLVPLGSSIQAVNVDERFIADPSVRRCMEEGPMEEKRRRV